MVGRAGNIPPLGLTAARLGHRIGGIATVRPYKSCLPSRLCCLSALVIGLLILSAVAAGSGWAQSMLAPQEAPSAAADEAITLSLPRSMSATERDELIGALVRHGATVIVTGGSTESAATTGGTGPSGSLAGQFEQDLADFEEKFVAMFARIGDLPGLVAFWLDRLSEGPDGSGVLLVLLGLALILVH